MYKELVAQSSFFVDIQELELIKRATAMPMRYFLLGAITLAGMTFATPEAKANDMGESVQYFGSYILYHWSKDPNLSKFNPPQIVTNIGSDTKVIGGCKSKDDGKIAQDIGGTSYCPTTNTIFVVQDELKPFYDFMGPSAIAYVMAHEYGHYIQKIYETKYRQPVSELQADCLAGAILGQGANDLGITPTDAIRMSELAYKIGSTSHGTGSQRAYAVYAGFGKSPEISCELADMEKLSRDQISDPIFHNYKSPDRSVRDSVDLDAQPQSYLRTISESLLGGV